ncbi:MAG: hypothetical protein ACKO91_16540 [Acidimicrobiales bacterium]
MPSLDRRTFLAGTAAAALLAACGDDAPTASGAGGGLSIVRYFDDGTQVPGPVRYPFGLADASSLLTSGLPDRLDGVILDDKGTQVATVSAPRRGEGVPRQYYAVRATLPAAGLYTLRATVKGRRAEAPFTVGKPEKVALPRIGAVLAPFDTPTATDARGVTPICTRNPACPFHAATLREALAGGKPVVYLVGTPAHCKTAVCGPVLDNLIQLAATLAGKVTVVHAEVYTDDTINTVAPAVKALGASFEPILFVTDATGTIVDRLDVLWDLGELREAVAKVVN